MTITKPVLVAAALLAIAACDNPRTRAGAPGAGVSPANTPGSTATTGIPTTSPVMRTPTAPTPGDPTAPTAARPQGAAPSAATGGGVPVPTRPGGAGGVGGGGQPSQAGTGSGSSR